MSRFGNSARWPGLENSNNPIRKVPGVAPRRFPNAGHQINDVAKNQTTSGLTGRPSLNEAGFRAKKPSTFTPEKQSIVAQESRELQAGGIARRAAFQRLPNSRIQSPESKVPFHNSKALGNISASVSGATARDSEEKSNKTKALEKEKEKGNKGKASGRKLGKKASSAGGLTAKDTLLRPPLPSKKTLPAISSLKPLMPSSSFSSSPPPVPEPFLSPAEKETEILEKALTKATLTPKAGHLSAKREKNFFSKISAAEPLKPAHLKKEDQILQRTLTKELPPRPVYGSIEKEGKVFSTISSVPKPQVDSSADKEAKILQKSLWKGAKSFTPRPDLLAAQREVKQFSKISSAPEPEELTSADREAQILQKSLSKGLQAPRPEYLNAQKEVKQFSKISSAPVPEELTSADREAQILQKSLSKGLQAPRPDYLNAQKDVKQFSKISSAPVPEELTSADREAQILQKSLSKGLQAARPDYLNAQKEVKQYSKISLTPEPEVPSSADREARILEKSLGKLQANRPDYNTVQREIKQLSKISSVPEPEVPCSAEKEAKFLQKTLTKELTSRRDYMTSKGESEVFTKIAPIHEPEPSPAEKEAQTLQNALKKAGLSPQSEQQRCNVKRQGKSISKATSSPEGISSVNRETKILKNTLAKGPVTPKADYFATPREFNPYATMIPPLSPKPLTSAKKTTQSTSVKGLVTSKVETPSVERESTDEHNTEGDNDAEDVMNNESADIPKVSTTAKPLNVRKSFEDARLLYELLSKEWGPPKEEERKRKVKYLDQGGSLKPVYYYEDEEPEYWGDIPSVKEALKTRAEQGDAEIPTLCVQEVSHDSEVSEDSDSVDGIEDALKVKQDQEPEVIVAETAGKREGANCGEGCSVSQSSDLCVKDIFHKDLEQSNETKASFAYESEEDESVGGKLESTLDQKEETIGVQVRKSEVTKDLKNNAHGEASESGLNTSLEQADMNKTSGEANIKPAAERKRHSGVPAVINIQSVPAHIRNNPSMVYVIPVGNTPADTHEVEQTRDGETSDSIETSESISLPRDLQMQKKGAEGLLHDARKDALDEEDVSGGENKMTDSSDESDVMNSPKVTTHQNMFLYESEDCIEDANLAFTPKVCLEDQGGNLPTTKYSFDDLNLACEYSEYKEDEIFACTKHVSEKSSSDYSVDKMLGNSRFASKIAFEAEIEEYHMSSQSSGCSTQDSDSRSPDVANAVESSKPQTRVLDEQVLNEPNKSYILDSSTNDDKRLNDMFSANVDAMNAGEADRREDAAAGMKESTDASDKSSVKLEQETVKRESAAACKSRSGDSRNDKPEDDSSTNSQPPCSSSKDVEKCELSDDEAEVGKECDPGEKRKENQCHLSYDEEDPGVLSNKNDEIAYKASDYKTGCIEEGDEELLEGKEKPEVLSNDSDMIAVKAVESNDGCVEEGDLELHNTIRSSNVDPQDWELKLSSNNEAEGKASALEEHLIENKKARHVLTSIEKRDLLSNNNVVIAGQASESKNGCIEVGDPKIHSTKMSSHVGPEHGELPLSSKSEAEACREKIAEHKGVTYHVSNGEEEPESLSKDSDVIAGKAVESKDGCVEEDNLKIHSASRSSDVDPQDLKLELSSIRETGSGKGNGPKVQLTEQSKIRNTREGIFLGKEKNSSHDSAKVVANPLLEATAENKSLNGAPAKDVSVQKNKAKSLEKTENASGVSIGKTVMSYPEARDEKEQIQKKDEDSDAGSRKREEGSFGEYFRLKPVFLPNSNTPNRDDLDCLEHKSLSDDDESTLTGLEDIPMDKDEYLCQENGYTIKDKRVMNKNQLNCGKDANNQAQARGRKKARRNKRKQKKEAKFAVKEEADAVPLGKEEHVRKPSTPGKVPESARTKPLTKDEIPIASGAADIARDKCHENISAFKGMTPKPSAENAQDVMKSKPVIEEQMPKSKDADKEKHVDSAAHEDVSPMLKKVLALKAKMIPKPISENDLANCVTPDPIIVRKENVGVTADDGESGRLYKKVFALKEKFYKARMMSFGEGNVERNITIEKAGEERVVNRERVINDEAKSNEIVKLSKQLLLSTPAELKHVSDLGMNDQVQQKKENLDGVENEEEEKRRKDKSLISRLLKMSQTILEEAPRNVVNAVQEKANEPEEYNFICPGNPLTNIGNDILRARSLISNVMKKTESLAKHEDDKILQEVSKSKQAIQTLLATDDLNSTIQECRLAGESKVVVALSTPKEEKTQDDVAASAVVIKNGDTLCDADIGYCKEEGMKQNQKPAEELPDHHGTSSHGSELPIVSQSEVEDSFWDTPIGEQEEEKIAVDRHQGDLAVEKKDVSVNPLVVNFRAIRTTQSDEYKAGSKNLDASDGIYQDKPKQGQVQRATSEYQENRAAERSDKLESVVDKRAAQKAFSCCSEGILDTNDHASLSNTSVTGQNEGEKAAPVKTEEVGTQRKVSPSLDARTTKEDVEAVKTVVDEYITRGTSYRKGDDISHAGDRDSEGHNMSTPALAQHQTNRSASKEDVVMDLVVDELVAPKISPERSDEQSTESSGADSFCDTPVGRVELERDEECVVSQLQNDLAAKREVVAVASAVDPSPIETSSQTTIINIKGIVVAANDRDKASGSGKQPTSASKSGGQRQGAGQSSGSGSKSEGNAGHGGAGEKPPDRSGGKSPNDSREEKIRRMKRALMKKLIRATDAILQQQFQTIVGEVKENRVADRNVAEDSQVNTSSASPGETQSHAEVLSQEAIIAALKEEASQTDDEGDVEHLQAAVRTKDREIKLLNTLVGDCRSDYEELQRSFDQYQSEFMEVDKTRELITKLSKQLDLKNKEAEGLKRTVVKSKDKILRIQADINTLSMEKMKLTEQLEVTPGKEVLVTSKSTESFSTDPSSTPLLRKSSSTGNVTALKAEDENFELRTKISILEDNLKKAKTECKKYNFKLSKLAKADKGKYEQIKSLEKKLSKFDSADATFNKSGFTNLLRVLQQVYKELSTARRELLSDDGEGDTLGGSLDQVNEESNLKGSDTTSESESNMLSQSILALTGEITQGVKKLKTKLSCQITSDVKLKVQEIREEYNSILMDEKAKSEALECLIAATNKENEKLRCHHEELEEDVSRLQVELRRTNSFRNRELNNLRRDLDRKENRQDQISMELDEASREKNAYEDIITALKEQLSESEEKVEACHCYVADLESEVSRLQDKLQKGKRDRQSKEKRPTGEDVKNMQVALEGKMATLNECLNRFNVYVTQNQEVRLHPCSPLLDSGMQVLYDASGLLRAINEGLLQVQYPSCDSVAEDSNENTIYDLEMRIKALTQENELLKAEKLALDSYVREKGNSDKVAELEAKLQESNLHLKQAKKESSGYEIENNNLKEQLDTATGRIESLNYLVADVQEQSAAQQQAAYLEMKNCIEKIKDLQGDVVKLGEVERGLQNSLSASELRNQALELEKSASQERLSILLTQNEAMNESLKDIEQQKQKIEKELSDVRNKTPTNAEKGDAKGIVELQLTVKKSNERIKELEDTETALTEKLQIFQAFFDQVQVDKHALQREIQAKEKTDSETELRNKVKTLTGRVSQLEEEKCQNNERIKLLLDSAAAKEELEKCLAAKEEAEQNLKDKLLRLESDHFVTSTKGPSCHLEMSESFEKKTKELEESLEKSRLSEELLTAQREELHNKLLQLEEASKILREQVIAYTGRSQDEIQQSKAVLRNIHKCEEADHLRAKLADMEQTIAKLKGDREKAIIEMEAMKSQRATELENSRQHAKLLTTNLKKQCAKEKELRKNIKELNEKLAKLSLENKDEGNTEKVSEDKVKIGQLSDEVKRFSEKERVLQIEIASLKENISQVAGEREKLVAGTESLAREKELLSKSSQEKINQLTDDLKDVLRREEVLKEQVSEMNQRIFEVNSVEQRTAFGGDIESARRRIDGIMQELDRSSSFNLTMHDQATTLQKEASKLVNENKSFKAENSRLQSENQLLSVYKANFEEMKHEKSKVLGDNKVMQTECCRLRSENKVLAACKREADELRTKVAQLRDAETDKKILEAEVRRLENEASMKSDQHSAKVDQLLQNIASHMDREKKLTQDANAINEELEKLKAEHTQNELRRQNDTIKQTEDYRKQAQELVKMTKIANSYMQSEKTLKAQLEAAYANVSALGEQNKKVEEDREKIKTKLKASLKSKERKISELGDDLARQSAREKALQKQVEGLESKVSELKVEKKKAEKDCSEIRDQMVHMSRYSKNTITSQKARITSLEEINEKSQRDLKKMSQNMDRLTSEKLALDFKAQGLKKELELAKQWYDEKATVLSDAVTKGKDQKQEVADQLKAAKEKITECELRLQETERQMKQQKIEAMAESERAHGTVNEMNRQIYNRRDIEEGLKQQILELEKHLTEFHREREGWNRERSEMAELHQGCQRRFALLEDTIKEKDAKMQTYRQTMDQLHNQILDAREEKRRAEQILESRFNSVLQQKDSQIQMMEFKMAETSRSLEEYKSSISELMKIIDDEQTRTRSKKNEMQINNEITNQKRATKMLFETLDQSESRMSNLVDHQRYLEDLRLSHLDTSHRLEDRGVSRALTRGSDASGYVASHVTNTSGFLTSHVMNPSDRMDSHVCMYTRPSTTYDSGFGSNPESPSCPLFSSFGSDVRSPSCSPFNTRSSNLPCCRRSQ